MNVNELDRYWYYYDDTYAPTFNVRPRPIDESGPSRIDVPAVRTDRTFPVDTRNSSPLLEYPFVFDSADENWFATMPFTLGTRWQVCISQLHRKAPVRHPGCSRRCDDPVMDGCCAYRTA